MTEPLEPYRIESGLVGRFGGLSFPLDPTQFDNGTFVSFDPVRSKLAALFKSALIYELRQVWPRLVATNTPLVNTDPVETVLELEPSAKTMKQVGISYPLLALHRVGEQVWSEYTMASDRCTQEWNLHYILPSLDIGDTRRIVDVFRIIPEIVRRVIRARGHVSYENGTLQFFPDSGMGIGGIKLTRTESGQSRFGGADDGPIWNAVTMTLETVEYGTDSADEFGTLDGIDWSLGIYSPTGNLPDAVQAWSEIG